MLNEQEGRGECFESYESLLKATLDGNGIEMERTREVFGKRDGN